MHRFQHQIFGLQQCYFNLLFLIYLIDNAFIDGIAYGYVLCRWYYFSLFIIKNKYLYKRMFGNITFVLKIFHILNCDFKN